METLASKQVYANRWMSVREDAIRRPDGSTGTYSVVDCRDIALVIPADGDRFHLVEQYRYPVAGRRWEFPSGTVEPRLDASPETVAARELREETGLVASTIRLLGVLEVTPSMLSHRCHVFLATGLTTGPADRDLEEQDMRSAWYSRRDLEKMMRDGTMTDSKSTAAYTLLLLHGRSGA